MKITVEVDAPLLGSKIKRAIEEDDRSISLISLGVGISNATLYNLMSERYERVSLQTIRKLEKLLGVEFGIDFSSVEELVA